MEENPRSGKVPHSPHLISPWPPGQPLFHKLVARFVAVPLFHIKKLLQPCAIGVYGPDGPAPIAVGGEGNLPPIGREGSQPIVGRMVGKIPYLSPVYPMMYISQFLSR